MVFAVSPIDDTIDKSNVFVSRFSYQFKVFVQRLHYNEHKLYAKNKYDIDL